MNNADGREGWAIKTLAWLGLIVMMTVAIAFPVVSYDTWWYHLPFSARLWGLGGGTDGFISEPLIEARWEGFPKAWHWIMGLAWRAGQDLRLVIVPQILLSLAYITVAAHLSRVPKTWVILGFFACPMLLIHFERLYLDLPAALCIALGFMLLISLIADAREPGIKFNWVNAMLAAAAIGLAGNIRYQGLLGGVAVLAIAGGLSIILPGVARMRRVQLIAVVSLSLILTGLTAFSNSLQKGNPFFPIEVRFPFGITLPGPESGDNGEFAPGYQAPGGRVVEVRGPAAFVLSATELDWTLRGVAPWYNLDALSGLTPRRGTPSRTGGWGSLFVLLNAVILAAQFVVLRRMAPRQALFAVATGLLILLTALLPRAHELRYWLYLPLVLIPVNLGYLYKNAPPRLVSRALALLTVYGATLVVLSPQSKLIVRDSFSVDSIRRQMPSEMVDALATTGRFCDDRDPLLFRFSAAVTGVKGQLSQRMDVCRSDEGSVKSP